MSVSDNVKQMSTVVPLGAGETYESGGLYLGGYSSLSLLGYADRAISIKIEFSGDNVNWDGAESRTIPGDSVFRETFPIIAKWVRMTVENVSGLGMAEMRVFTYGEVEGGKGGGGGGGVGSLPTTLTTALEVGEFSPEVQYVFDRISPSGTDTSSVDGIITEYKDIQSWSSTGTVDYSGGGNGLRIDGIFSPTLKSTIWGRAIHCKAGQPMRSVFSGGFQQGTRGVGGDGAVLMYLGVGVWSEAGSAFRPEEWRSFIGFGFVRETHPNPVTAEDFGIVYGSDGVFIRVVQADWNIDKADGQGSLPNISDWLFGNAHTYRIDYLCEGDLVFSMMSPRDGRFYPVHQVVENIPISQQSFGLGVYYENPTGVIVAPGGGIGTYVGISSGMVGFVGRKVEDRYTTYVDETPIPSGAYGSETTIVNYRVGTYFEETDIQYTSDVELTSLGFVFNGSGAQVNGIIRMYRNLAIGGTPSFSKNQAYNVHIPLEKDIAGTVTVYPSTTYPQLTQAAQLMFAPINELETQNMDLTPFHFLLKKGDTLTVTYVGGTASVGGIMSLGFKTYR